MHASTQHNKAEIIMRSAQELLASSGVLLQKSQESHDAMQQKIALQEKQHSDAHKKLDDDIRAELDKVTKAADEYIASLE